MAILKFHNTECAVDFLLNVLSSEELKEVCLNSGIFNTDFFEIVLLKKRKGNLLMNDLHIEISSNVIAFISPFQKLQWKLEAEDLDLRC